MQCALHGAHLMDEDEMRLQQATEAFPTEVPSVDFYLTDHISCGCQSIRVDVILPNTNHGTAGRQRRIREKSTHTQHMAPTEVGKDTHTQQKAPT